MSARIAALELRPNHSGPSHSGERRSSHSIWKGSSDEPGSNKHSVLSNYTNNSANSATPTATATTIQVEVEETEEMEEISVSFEESAWSIPMVIGLVRAGRFDMAYAVVLLLVNCAMQIMFALILLDDGFMGDDFAMQKLNAQIWRTSVAHDYKYMDLAETSLVTRVCNGDGALILSTKQASLVEQINMYLKMDTDQFMPDDFGPGVLLCMLCILLWSLCVYKEFRHIWLAVAGAVNIPRSRRTNFTEGTFHQISWGRFCVFLATNFTRVAVASVLLVAGILWLARTTSISELMLNAVALNAILDVDEFLFNGLTPMKFQHAIQSLSPLTIKYSRRRSEWESSVQCLLLIGTIVVPYMLLVKPFGETMVEVKELLCGGNQTFVVHHNSDTQLTYGLITRGGRGNSENLSISEIAATSLP
ncbi:NLRC3 [Symbiodinium natans]|uniref:NLRC3 protein n=1 Tax=Symbiodinium natans TaxID=878477 RepID=A0A812IZE6_9DINO|nr:NLRC3 [Symbiodinium natans]